MFHNLSSKLDFYLQYWSIEHPKTTMTIFFVFFLAGLALVAWLFYCFGKMIINIFF